MQRPRPGSLVACLPRAADVPFFTLDRTVTPTPHNPLGAKGAANGAIPADQTLLFDLTLISSAPPVPGQDTGDNPFSLWGNGRENGAAFTIRQ